LAEALVPVVFAAAAAGVRAVVVAVPLAGRLPSVPVLAGMTVLPGADRSLAV